MSFYLIETIRQNVLVHCFRLRFILRIYFYLLISFTASLVLLLFSPILSSSFPLPLSRSLFFPNQHHILKAARQHYQEKIQISKLIESLKSTRVLLDFPILGLVHESHEGNFSSKKNNTASGVSTKRKVQTKRAQKTRIRFHVLREHKHRQMHFSSEPVCENKQS